MKITIEIPDDSNIHDVISVFKGSLVACGWSTKLVDEYIKEQE